MRPLQDSGQQTHKPCPCLYSPIAKIEGMNIRHAVLLLLLSLGVSTMLLFHPASIIKGGIVASVSGVETTSRQDRWSSSLRLRGFDPASTNRNNSTALRNINSYTYPRRRRLNPSVGTNLRILVLLVKFSDHANRTVPPRRYFNQLFNGDGVSPINPIGSIKDYLRYNSLGKYGVKFDVRDWAVTTGNESSYAAGISGVVGPTKLQKIFYPILDKLDMKEAINWTNGYVDANGLINHLVVIHSGIDASYGNLSCVPETAENRITSFGSASSSGGWSSIDFNTVNGWMIASAFGPPSCNSRNALDPLPSTTISGIITLYMYGLGLTPMFDQDRPKIQLGGLGRFDVMSSPHGWDPNGTTCGHLSPYSRIMAKWLEPIPIIQDGFYALQPQEISGAIYKISKNFPSGEYLLIENKQPMLWDSDLPSGGIVIYHVDEKADGQTKRGYPGLKGWPASHYRVAVLQKDGEYGIEKGTDLGDLSDMWIKGDILGPTNKTWPNTMSYQRGVLKNTGITIKILTTPGYVATIQVSGVGNGTKP